MHSLLQFSWECSTSFQVLAGVNRTCRKKTVTLHGHDANFLLVLMCVGQNQGSPPRHQNLRWSKVKKFRKIRINEIILQDNRPE